MKKRSESQLRFFADENFSFNLVEILRIFSAGDARIDAHRDYFKRGTSDEELLTTIGTWHPKPIYLGGDGRILTNAARLNALSEAGIHFVYYVGGYCNLEWPQLVISTLKSWNAVCQSVRREAKPTIFKVKSGGKVVVVRRVADQTGHRNRPRGNQNKTDRSA